MDREHPSSDGRGYAFRFRRIAIEISAGLYGRGRSRSDIGSAQPYLDGVWRHLLSLSTPTPGICCRWTSRLRPAAGLSVELREDLWHTAFGATVVFTCSLTYLQGASFT
jgi:hypothetical protein